MRLFPSSKNHVRRIDFMRPLFDTQIIIESHSFKHRRRQAIKITHKFIDTEIGVKFSCSGNFLFHLEISFWKIFRAAYQEHDSDLLVEILFQVKVRFTENIPFCKFYHPSFFTSITHPNPFLLNFQCILVINPEYLPTLKYCKFLTARIENGCKIQR